MTDRDFLKAELDHAARQLERLRRIAAQMEARLAAQGLDELAVYEQLATSKAYRQLQRDQVVFQQMWIRVHRYLQRVPEPGPPPLPRIPLYLVEMAEPLDEDFPPPPTSPKRKLDNDDPPLPRAA